MIRNYILIAVRSLWRNKVISLINLLGMAVGFGIFVTLLSWIRFDARFDKFHEDIDRMYLLNIRLTMNGGEYTSQRTGGIYARVLKEMFPQVENSCRVSPPYQFELGVPVDEAETGVSMKFYDENQVVMVDSNFFSYFSFPLVEGDPGRVFTARDQIVITERLAKKLFGDQSALNREIKIGEGGYFTVVAVAQDPPVASSYQFNALLGFHVLEEMGYPLEGYGGTMYFNHFKLAEGTDLATLDEAINEHVQEHLDADFDSWFFMDRFDRLHLFGESSQGWIGYMLNVIMAVVILLIACINFINLTTAGSSQRLKEIAIRKSAGASRRQLVIQFMSESYILLLLALYLGFFIAEHLSGTIFQFFDIYKEKIPRGAGYWLLIVGVYLLTGLLSGLYPALKISGYRPLAFFSGTGIENPRSGRRSRRVLIVLQFAFSIFFITVSIFIIRQFTYLREADLGFNRDNVLYIRTKGKVWNRYPLIKQDLEQLSWVKGVTSASDIPVEVNYGDIDWGERDGEHNKFARVIRTSPDFLSTFDIRLLDGEYFTEDRDSLNYSYVVVNRGLVDYMGWENPVGRDMYLWGGDRTILGVVDNIQFFPFTLGAFDNEALIYVYEPVQDYVFVRVVPGTTSGQLSDIEEVFRKYNPGYELEYDYVRNYKYGVLNNADGVSIVFKIFSAIAIFIAVMGLLGLSLHNNTRRTKEVGIHKAMGARTGSVMNLLLSEFMKLVILSNLIALPLAYLGLWRLFQFFSYSTELKLPVFVIVFICSVVFSMLTVMYHAWRTARANPVVSLRYE